MLPALKIMQWNLREPRTIQSSWECLGMKIVKMSPCLTSCPALGCSLHCHQMFVAAHILLWSRMSWSSLVHHPGSNELPGSVNVAGRPWRLSITGQLGRDMVGQQEMMSPLAALWWPLGDIYKIAKTQQWAGSQGSFWLLLITDPFTLVASI